jgi:acyl-homoserine-lactone acylase
VALFGSLAALVAALSLLAGGSDLFGAGPMEDRVEIRRDTFGVPHILADDLAAGGFGFGYAMAEDHAAEIGRRYLQARGEAARYFGAGELESDLAMRRLENRELARRALREHIGRDFRRWLEGFAAGVNQYSATHPDAVPAWMPVVEPSDPLAYGRMFGVLAAVDVPGRLVSKYEVAGREGPPDVPDGDNLPSDEPGSNALALSGTKTASGRPILLGNPHLRWSFLYWEAHVTVADRINFYGSTLVGIPVLRAGFNDRLGYVQTNNGPDLEDIYALPLAPGRPDAYVHNGRPHRIDRREVAVEVVQPDGRAVTERREYEETRLGPVIHRSADRVFVVRSVHLEWWRNYEGFFELQQVRSLAEFRRSLARGLIVTSNYTYADADGNILYVWNARLPRRPDAAIDYELDVPGDTDRLFWDGIHPWTELPWLLNPVAGYIQNANNPPWWTSLGDPLDPAWYTSSIEGGQLSLRAQAVLDALEATPTFSPEAVRELKFTTRLRLADRLLPDLLAAAKDAHPPSAALTAGHDTLASWDRRVSAESRGAVLFDRFLSIYDDLSDERYALPWDPEAPMATPDRLADPEAAVAALAQAVLDVRAAHGSEQVAWGDVHRFRFGDIDLPGDGATGQYGLFRVVTFDPAGGGVRVAGHVAPGEPLAGFGDGWVLLVHFTEPVTAWSVLAYGQTANLDSPHSRDQIRLFADHALRPVWFSESAIAANLERRYRPGAPRQGAGE